MFFGREYSREQLLAHCGSAHQLARILSCELNDGKERGVRCLVFQTGGGLNFTVVPDRGMDIAYADYFGKSLSWVSPSGLVAPQFYEPEGWSWIRGFYGGLLTTCGLVNVGAPDVIDDEAHGAHGRISYTPATNVSYDMVWAGDDLFLLARGEMREYRMNRYNLVLKRRIQVRAGDTCLRIHDTLVNEGRTAVPYQIIYHINTGFPILTRDAYFVTPSRMITPRDQRSDEVKEHWRLCNDPTNNFQELIYYHDVVPCSDGKAWAGLINPTLENGLGIYVKYDPKVLPILMQWKMFGEGTYVMGIEPTNSFGLSFERQKALGMVYVIQPEQEIDFHLEIGVLASTDEIGMFEREISVAMPNPPDFGSILE